jgi:hypothetical protein
VRRQACSVALELSSYSSVSYVAILLHFPPFELLISSARIQFRPTKFLGDCSFQVPCCALALRATNVLRDQMMGIP